MNAAKSGHYTPSIDQAAVGSASDQPNASGYSPRYLLNQEASAQRAVAESEKWLIACRTNMGCKDSREALEKLGFKVVSGPKNLFYEVEPPKGWTKSTNGYWTTVCDETGAKRFTQFFKGASYDYDAFVNLD